MSRNALHTAGIILLILSFFMPWFAVTYSNEFMVRENQYEDGAKIDYNWESEEKFYLDHSKDSASYEMTKGDEEESDFFGNYSYYREGMETNGSIETLPGFLYSIYKIIFLVMALAFVVVTFEAFSSSDNLKSMKIGIPLLLTIILLVFISGVKESYLADRGDRVMAVSSNSNEYVNMTLPIGFNTLIVNETYVQAYELTNFTYEADILTIADYNNTWNRSYIQFRAGPGPDDLEWDQTWNSSADEYYIWFLKTQAVNNPQKFFNESMGGFAGTPIMVDISDLNSSTKESSSIISNRILNKMNSLDVPFTVSPTSPEDNERGWYRLSFTAQEYGETAGIFNWNWNGDIENTVEGTTTYEPIYGDYTIKINWYPSVGFLVAIISLISFLGSFYREYF